MQACTHKVANGDKSGNEIAGDDCLQMPRANSAELAN